MASVLPAHQDQPLGKRLTRENSAGSSGSGGAHWRDSIAPDVVEPRTRSMSSSKSSVSSIGSWREAIAPDVTVPQEGAISRSAVRSNSGKWREAIAPDVEVEDL
mmetsp:Transcript_19327/g.42138  ORF Transcript_19327/g.42138 Transcript_19327/m.42138 type:complete len:104 (-) Transcript_19327:366-677(-)|eukprot:CAMPEP_0170582392 /NCGR_PEP_ID=MMETSP0224-20130122/7559_1 /TAXON_ID=285029 /ORGANISM="Togula jolla, Strain CCCM 725" /LENGTH=103 /DNA_ID=CAMNT_0010905613 /DNA_START=67 /DNA_END=378 /DNA_ORIENTATION=+